jgi:hypothetical protein
MKTPLSSLLQTHHSNDKLSEENDDNYREFLYSLSPKDEKSPKELR